MKNFYTWKRLLVAATWLLSHLSLSAQDTIYATAQTTGSNGLCGSCRVLDGENAVNNSNLDDYATLSLGVSLLGANISQTLIFPQEHNDGYSEITIDIAPSDEFSLNLLGAVAVSTSRGGLYNNDRHIIPDDELKRRPNSNRVSYTFISAKPLDRVTIELNGGILALGTGLRTYYARINRLDNITECADAPGNAFAYYPLDDNVKDYGPNRLHGFTTGMRYLGDSSCDRAAYDSTPGGQGFSVNNFFLSDTAVTFSWLVSMQEGKPEWWPGAIAELEVHQYKFRIQANHASFICSRAGLLSELLEPSAFDEVKEGGDFRGTFHHIVATRYKDVLALYIDGQLSAYLHRQRLLAPPESIGPVARFRMTGCYVDELLVYDRALNEQEVERLFASYATGDTLAEQSPARAAYSSATHLKTAYAEPDKSIRLMVTPNPVTGTFRINQDIKVENSTVVLIDLSGRELYRIQPSSHTITLPGKVLPGVYVLRVITREGTIYSAKVVVNR